MEHALGSPAGPKEAPVVLTKSGRRRRFKRTPEFRPDHSRAGRLAITARDLSVIATTAQLRFLSMHQACRLFACDCPRQFVGNKISRPAPVLAHRPNCHCTCGVGNGREAHASRCVNLYRDDQHLARRMREMFQLYGYLDRPIAQLQLRVRNGIVNPGSVSMVYAVTQAGLDLLPEETRAALHRGKLTFAGKHDGGRLYMDHTLRIGDVHVALTVGLRTRPDLRRIPEAEMVAAMPKKRQEAQFPFALRVKHKARKLVAICDLPIGIEYIATGKRRLILTEVDMASMPVMRKGTSQSSLVKKIMAYAQAYTSKLIEKELGFSSVQVLILTTSETRVAHCVEMVKTAFAQAPNLGRLFLFGTHKQAENLMTATFIDGRGRTVRLFEDPIAE